MFLGTARTYQMTRPTTDNLAARALTKALGVILPVEYARRAGPRLAPMHWAQLDEVNASLWEEWRKCGLSDDEIRDLKAVDECWDRMQLGYVAVRRWADVPWDEDMYRTREDIVAKLGERFPLLSVPFCDRFRMCDLANGNDIAAAIRQVRKKAPELARIRKGAEILASKFVLGLREPIPLQPGAQHGITLNLDGTDSRDQPTHLALALRYDMSLADVRAAFREFQYLYAKFREEKMGRGRRDPVVGKFFVESEEPHRDEVIDSASSFVTRWDALLVGLNGLYCWDRREHHGGDARRGSLQAAIGDVQNLDESGQESEATIRSHYKKVRGEIDRLIDQERPKWAGAA